AGARAERSMLGAPAALDCDYMTAAHHGSRTSSGAAFLAVVAPEAAFITCGEENAYGHPHAETLERLREIGACVYRTDRDGSIALFTDGHTAHVETTTHAGAK
ncbi:MAG: MBL fold metallo-hydrolase, partial [Candidatus Sumerlaeota bacterium]|nr:MBL fold metallo-hydrolase [Candidatus Sumerlaeota bacterium]